MSRSLDPGLAAVPADRDRVVGLLLTGSDLPADGRIGCFNAAFLGYFHGRRNTNPDRLVNPETDAGVLDLPEGMKLLVSGDVTQGCGDLDACGSSTRTLGDYRLLDSLAPDVLTPDVRGGTDRFSTHCLLPIPTSVR